MLPLSSTCSHIAIFSTFINEAQEEKDERIAHFGINLSNSCFNAHRKFIEACLLRIIDEVNINPALMIRQTEIANSLETLLLKVYENPLSNLYKLKSDILGYILDRIEFIEITEFCIEATANPLRSRIVLDLHDWKTVRDELDEDDDIDVAIDTVLAFIDDEDTSCTVINLRNLNLEDFPTEIFSSEIFKRLQTLDIRGSSSFPKDEIICNGRLLIISRSS